MGEASAAQRDLGKSILTARTVADADAIEEAAAKLYGVVGWRHVGDRPNNIGTIRVGSDPALGVVERVINAQDALLDLGHLQHPSDNPASPIEAARQWYGIPAGGIAEMTNKERRTLGELIRVRLAESGEPRRPTVVWEDAGTGQSPRRFPSTLVSLNEDNKVGQKWNMGTYGQGGAVTFGYSRRTLIVSRRHPDFRGDQPDMVGWTIVKEVETDPEKDILPTYMYLVGDDDEVPTLPPDAFPDLAHGTRITAIAYDLQGWTGPFTTGLWQFLHAAIFEPVLPFEISGTREKEVKYGSRIVIGNAARLDRPDRARGDLEVAHRDSIRLDLGPKYGSITLNYWVVRRPAGSPSKTGAAAGYVRPDSAVSMTLYGQRQDVESRSWIKTNARLPFLYKNMIVQINANGLTPIAKREIFATTRERATNSDLKTTIYKELVAVLRGDDELRRLNHVERERLLELSTLASSEKVRKRLGRFIKTRLRDLMRRGKGGTAPGTGATVANPRRPRPTSPPRSVDDSHLHRVPTKLVIARRAMRVKQGSTCWTWIEVDAKNGYLPAHNDNLTVEISGGAGKVRLKSRSELLGGKSKWVFGADPDAPLEEVKVTVQLMTAAGLLTDSAVIDVIQPPEAEPDTKGTEPETGPQVRWVRKAEWPEHDMTAQSVGYVTEDEEETIIFVNRNFFLLDRALAARTLTADQVETRADRYQFPVAVGLWFHHEANKDAEPQPSEAYRRAEMERLAEAVLLAADPDVDLAGESSQDYPRTEAHGVRTNVDPLAGGGARTLSRGGSVSHPPASVLVAGREVTLL